MEAIEKFKSNRYDLILMDIQMPVLDGLNATKKIREIETLRNSERVMIWALTADAYFSQQKKSIEFGCDEHISKPIVKKDFISKITKHFNVFKKSA